MKVYTKTGDEGQTGLFGGKRVSKSCPRIIAYGDLDELNAILGMVCAETTQDPVRKTLLKIQHDLFNLGAQLASPDSESLTQVVTSAHVDALERQIDAISENLPPLKEFILPGGGKTSALLHMARTVCRRAERQAVQLSLTEGEDVDRWALIYLNRLSDFLFVLARLANQLEGVEDTTWKK